VRPAGSTREYSVLFSGDPGDPSLVSLATSIAVKGS
jgi:hypothetical protein